MSSVTPPTSPSSICLSHSLITCASDSPFLVALNTNKHPLSWRTFCLASWLIKPCYFQSPTVPTVTHGNFPPLLLSTPKCLPHSNQPFLPTYLVHLIFQINPTSTDVSPKTSQSHPGRYSLEKCDWVTVLLYDHSPSFPQFPRVYIVSACGRGRDCLSWNRNGFEHLSGFTASFPPCYRGHWAWILHRDFQVNSILPTLCSVIPRKLCNDTELQFISSIR